MNDTVKPTEDDQAKNQTSELDNLRIEYETTSRLLSDKKDAANRAQLSYSPFQNKLEELRQARDRLNEKNRKTRKDIKDNEDLLRYLKGILSKDETDVSNIRTEIKNLERKAKPFQLPYQQAWSEYLKLKKSLDEIKKKITEMEIRMHHLGSKEKETQDISSKPNQKRLEVFYAIILIIILVAVPAISFVFSLPLYGAVIIFVCALLGVWVLSAIQLRNDGKLSEENFLTLMIETIKQIPELLKGIAKRW